MSCGYVQKGHRNSSNAAFPAAPHAGEAAVTTRCQRDEALASQKKSDVMGICNSDSDEIAVVSPVANAALLEETLTTYDHWPYTAFGE